MAGTPTQYYGFPTYADSDAVDLTAQYNTAVTNIDSELHQIDVAVDGIEENAGLLNVLVVGDSWVSSGPVGSTTTRNAWLNLLQDMPGIGTVYGYGVSGGRLTDGTISARLDAAIADLSGTRVDVLLIVAGVNDSYTGDMLGGVNGLRTKAEEAFPGIRTVWCPNAPNDYDKYKTTLSNLRTNLQNYMPVSQSVVNAFELSTNVIKFVLSNPSSFTEEDKLHPSTSIGQQRVAYGAYHAVTGRPFSLRVQVDGARYLYMRQNVFEMLTANLKSSSTAMAATYGVLVYIFDYISAINHYGTSTVSWGVAFVDSNTMTAQSWTATGDEGITVSYIPFNGHV